VTTGSFLSPVAASFPEPHPYKSATAVRITSDGGHLARREHDLMAYIVVGIDGSDQSKHALRWALDEARLRHTSLRVVYAWTMPIYVGYGVTAGPVFDPTELRDAAQARVDKTVEEVVGNATGVDVEGKAVEGPPASVLVEEADGADLLVVGSRGHGGFTGLLLGSVGQQCAHHARCPVVIVRE
jgi:nucleotide-binding universal stress UspA family protein